MPSFSIVIAAYNEEETLRRVFERSLAVVKDCTDDYEIIILDDGSTDQTGSIAASLKQQYPDVLKVISRKANKGIAETFEELFRAATKEYVFDVPADGEYPPEALREIIPLLSEYDIVVCNRTFKNYTMYRRIVSFSYRWLPRLLFGVDLYDPGSTKCRKKEVIDKVPVTSKGVFVEAERLVRAVRHGHRLGKVNVIPERRMAGDPRGAGFSNVFQAIIDLFYLWVRLTCSGSVLAQTLGDCAPISPAALSHANASQITNPKGQIRANLTNTYGK